MLRRNAVLTGCLMLSVIAGTPALAAYAIALNTSSGKAAAYNGSFDLETAKRQALSQCGGGCRIVASGKGSCAAAVESISTGTGQWAVAKAPPRTPPPSRPGSNAAAKAVSIATPPPRSATDPPQESST
jgi:Domain of unknown function (DUF4189)